MTKLVTRKLNDEYELSQLNPVYSGAQKRELTDVEKVLNSIPEKTSMKLRLATLEAVIDDVIETKIEQAEEEHAAAQPAAEPGENPVPQTEPAPVTGAEIEEAVAPVVDTAVALHLAPSSLKKKLPQMIAKHLRTVDPYYALLAKTAKFVADSVVEIKNEDLAGLQEVDAKPADEGTNIADPDTPVEPKGDTAQEGGKTDYIDSPTGHANWMRFFMEDSEVGTKELDTKPADTGVDISNPDTPVEPKGDTAQEGGVDETKYNGMRWLMEDGNTCETGAAVNKPEDGAAGNDGAGTVCVDDKPADTGYNIEEEVVKLDDCTTQEGGSVPTVQNDALRYLAASAINKRKATALVSRKLTGVLLSRTLYELRNCLPKWYKAKYNLK